MPAGCACDTVFCICVRMSAPHVVVRTATFSLGCIKGAKVYVNVVFSSP